MDLGERFRKLRLMRGWTQGRMAELLGVSPAMVSRYESNEAEPRWSLVVRLMDVLGVDIRVFTRDEVNWREVERQYYEKRIQELRNEGPDVLPYKGSVARGLLVGGAI